jgi:hypothetical protein
MAVLVAVLGTSLWPVPGRAGVADGHGHEAILSLHSPPAQVDVRALVEMRAPRAIARCTAMLSGDNSAGLFGDNSAGQHMRRTTCSASWLGVDSRELRTASPRG